jgi:hypothetical protein
MHTFGSRKDSWIEEAPEVSTKRSLLLIVAEWLWKGVISRNLKNMSFDGRLSLGNRTIEDAQQAKF